MTRVLADEDLINPAADLIRPLSLTIDGGHSEDAARHLVSIAQLLYTFWHTGNTEYLLRAVDDAFVDNTLPPGRPQGPSGPAAASKLFRLAIPDLTCELYDLLVVGNKLAARLRFRGHFTGVFNRISGAGQAVDFIAFDIQHVGSSRITEDWHLEDNLTFLSQAGLAVVAQGE
jgi:predicted ester cyclase